MSEIHAAYALASLDEWPVERAEWLTAQYAAKESQVGQSLPHVQRGVITPNPYWIVDCGSRTTRELLEKELDAAGIGTRRWWSSGLHAMPAFGGSPEDSPFPNTDTLADNCLGLPMFRGIRPDQIRSIAEVVSRILKSSEAEM